jgi:2'-5' RNA ligase
VTAWDVLAAMSDAAQPDYSGSCMIALYPPPDVAANLAVPGGLPPDEIHLTVAYTGDCADVDQFTLVSAANALATRPPLDVTISGHARFTGDPDGDVIVALADSPALDVLRRDAETALAVRGIDLPSEHGFTAHMTICYCDPADPGPVVRIEPFPVTFAGVSAEYGTQRYTFPFSAAPEASGDAGEAPARDGWDSLERMARQRPETFPASPQQALEVASA